MFKRDAKWKRARSAMVPAVPRECAFVGKRMDAHVGAAGELPLCELASALRNRRIVPAAMSVAQTFGEFRAEQENLRRLIDPSQQDHQL